MDLQMGFGVALGSHRVSEPDQLFSTIRFYIQSPHFKHLEVNPFPLLPSAQPLPAATSAQDPERQTGVPSLSPFDSCVQPSPLLVLLLTGPPFHPTVWAATFFAGPFSLP